MVEHCDVLAFGAHPDDVELGCGATLARLAATGKNVAIVDLTAGELSTRGTVEQRRREAEKAAGALGVVWRRCLHLPDGAINCNDTKHTEAVVEILRLTEPRVLFLPHPADPHPDHGQAAALVERAAFFAGVRNFAPALGSPARPRMLLAYPGPRQIYQPTVVFDVSTHYAAKRNALAAYASQFDPVAGAPTHLASGHFITAIEGRDRAFGNTIGVEFGEGFIGLGVMAADEFGWLLPA